MLLAEWTIDTSRLELTIQDFASLYSSAGGHGNIYNHDFKFRWSMINAITATLLKNSAYSNKNKNRAHLRKAKFEKPSNFSCDTEHQVVVQCSCSLGYH